jgi:hypothetical protein
LSRDPSHQAEEYHQLRHSRHPRQVRLPIAIGIISACSGILDRGA